MNACHGFVTVVSINILCLSRIRDGGAVRVKEAQDHIKAQEAEITLLRGQLDSEKARVKEMWRLNCMQLSQFDASLAEKDEEITQLKEHIHGHSQLLIEHKC